MCDYYWCISGCLCVCRLCLRKASEVACLLRSGHLTVALQGESHDAGLMLFVHYSHHLPLPWRSCEHPHSTEPHGPEVLTKTAKEALMQNAEPNSVDLHPPEAYLQILSLSFHPVIRGRSSRSNGALKAETTLGLEHVGVTLLMWLYRSEASSVFRRNQQLLKRHLCFFKYVKLYYVIWKLGMSWSELDFYTESQSRKKTIQVSPCFYFNHLLLISP